ncbi:hypothetical protein [Clostridium thermarum]|uniref:hypothetical protein n=1 Tax=Clostridium thermarum TaxID=1716543 RepID=UPI0013CF8788|nr:hypothetical protein [Clostridium thermarum]
MEFLTSSEAERYCSKRLQQDICEEELKEIIKITKIHNIQWVEAEANMRLGDKYFYKYNYTEVVKCYFKVVDYYEKFSKNEKISLLYNLIGACKYAELMYEEALVYFDKANIYALKGKQALLNLYEGTSNTNQIEELFISIIELLKDKNPQELKKTYLEIAEFYIKQGKLDKANKYMDLSHNI